MFKPRVRATIMALLSALAFAGRNSAADSNSPNDINPVLPASVSSTAELGRAFEGHSGFGTPQSTVLTSRQHHYIFVIWNCPYSGVDLNHIWAYDFDGQHWKKFYTGAIHAPPSAVKPSIDEVEDQLIIDGRRPSDQIRVPLKSLSSPDGT